MPTPQLCAEKCWPSAAVGLLHQLRPGGHSILLCQHHPPEVGEDERGL